MGGAGSPLGGDEAALDQPVDVHVAHAPQRFQRGRLYVEAVGDELLDHRLEGRTRTGFSAQTLDQRFDVRMPDPDLGPVCARHGEVEGEGDDAGLDAGHHLVMCQPQPITQRFRGAEAPRGRREKWETELHSAALILSRQSKPFSIW